MKTFGGISRLQALGFLLMTGQLVASQGQTDAQKANANRTLSVGYVSRPTVFDRCDTWDKPNLSSPDPVPRF